MRVGTISNYNYNNYYEGIHKTGANVPFNPTTDNITLKLTDEDTGANALTCVGFPNGGSASVYKADDYTDENPTYKVKYWDNISEKEFIINPKDINPANASYTEMLAYSTYSDIQGFTSDAFGKFLSAAKGVNVDYTYDLNNIDVKMNFKSLVKEFMEMQYNANNIQGYLSFKHFYDYMENSSGN